MGAHHNPQATRLYLLLSLCFWKIHEAGMYVSFLLCALVNARSPQKKNERREGPGLTAVCAHWNNLTACLSLTTMESPPSIQGAAFQGISWWEIFNRLQEMPETGSLCKDVRNSLLNPPDPPLPHPGQAIAPRAQPGPPGSLD